NSPSWTALKDFKETPKVHISSRSQFQGLVSSGDRDQPASPPAKLSRPQQLSVNGQSAKNGPNPPNDDITAPTPRSPSAAFLRARSLSPSPFRPTPAPGRLPHDRNPWRRPPPGHVNGSASHPHPHTACDSAHGQSSAV